MSDKTRCHKCTNLLSNLSDFGRQDSCPKCLSSTHCCLNCIHYDRSKYNECAENAADRVVDKEKFNFCDFFKPCGNSRKPGPLSSKDSNLTESEKARLAAEALFKKK